MTDQTGQNAIVIGGSMAGLLTARVLSDHFAQVTLFERDRLRDQPEARFGQPQANHLHGLLGRGLQSMVSYFPTLVDALRSGGATVTDMGRTMRWYCDGGYRLPFEFGQDCVIASRPFLEWQVRQQVVALPNVTVLDSCRVHRLLTSEEGQQIAGVQFTRSGTDAQSETRYADLTVDATGRGSRSPQWLTELGYSPPPESKVVCHTSYATQVYRRATDGQPSDWIFITPTGPQEKRGGVALPIEDGRWIVTLSGRQGAPAPTDTAGFLSFSQGLPAPDIAVIASHCEPLSAVYNYNFAASLRHHYEQLKRFPAGYLVLGDAVCCFNPLYGQGMTTAALQAEALDELLHHPGDPLQDIARKFFRRAAELIDIPWQTAVAEDFRYPETQGKKSPGTTLINAYITCVNRASHRDPLIGAAFLKVMNMMAPPTSLFQPQILWRVLRSQHP
ncbi:MULTISPECIES: FAD-binding monooxygenase [Cyanophyceae]|uniref:NAD(P)/FAD-dependent oxidoreductase n=1 Tax=Cyanophyceae TaxID=3028117 RepID=UPI00168582FB|nr:MULTISPECIES: FAD-binding monooxygenase [Cyanophyceae]MBD1916178.1 FAD-binding monooxygenase [Phormidium sp. FACHB-77]MBD2031553.1 FAD-binding monooxygenase [Phormidium sp. FACHB-322]MBD2052820.1 FAD-binding monooxygenase [Leptolyngbya sp. FACHB-60]